MYAYSFCSSFFFACDGLVVIHIGSYIQDAHVSISFVLAYMLASIVELSVYFNCKRAYIIRTYTDMHKAYESVIWNFEYIAMRNDSVALLQSLHTVAVRFKHCLRSLLQVY